MSNRQGRANYGIITATLLLHFYGVVVVIHDHGFSYGEAIGCSVEERSAVCGSTNPNLNVSFPFGFNYSNSVYSSAYNNCSALPEFNLRCSDAISWWPATPEYNLSHSLGYLMSVNSDQVSSGSFVISAPTTASVNICSFLDSSIYTATQLLKSVPTSIGLSFELCNNTMLFLNCTNASTPKLESDPYGISEYSNRSFCRTLAYDCYGSDGGGCLEAPRYASYSAESLSVVTKYAHQTYGCVPEPLVLFQIPEVSNVSEQQRGTSTVATALQLQLSWTITQSYYDCVACSRSGGTCSSDNVTDVFRCTSCPDGTTSNSSLGSNVCAASNSTSSDTNFNLTIGGIAIAAALVVVASGIGCYCCWSKSQGFGEAKQEAEKLRRLLSQLSSDYKAAARRNRAAAANKRSSPFHEQSTVSCKVFTYRELMDATEGFSDSKLIGDGGFGMVYEGRIEKIADDASTSASTRVAVKRLFSDNRRRVEQFVNEIRILSGVRHPNLVHLHGFCCEESLNELLLVYEFAANGSLSDNVHGGAGKGLLWETRLSIALETARALAYLHSQKPPVVHRDVKSSNILLDDAFHAKLADFGLSRVWAGGVGHVSTAPQGTPGYVDPAYHQSYQLTEKSDVYSFGVVLAELITGKLPVDMSRENTEINLSSLAVSKIQTGALYEIVDPFLEVERYPSVKDMVTRVAELALQCLAPVKDDRPSMDAVARDLHDIARSAGYVSASATCYNGLQISSSATGSTKRRWLRLSGSPHEHSSSESSLTDGSAPSFNNNNDNSPPAPPAPPDLPFLILAT